MTTDITELAQREKFEAWAEECNALPWGYLKKRRTYDGFYSEHTYTSLWAAWKAASAEMVEALEKAQSANAAQDDHINQQQDRIDQLEKGHRHAAKCINSWRRLAKQSIAEQEKCVDELDAARQRIVDLDRKNSELNSLTQRWAVERAENAERIAELESRTVTVKQGEVLVTVAGFTGCGKSAIAGEIEIALKAIGVSVTWVNGDAEKRMTGADWLTAIEMYKPTVRIVEVNIPRAAGIKWEAE